MSNKKGAPKKPDKANREQYLFSFYNVDGDNDDISEWVNNQANKSVSFRLVISQLIKMYGTGDIVDILMKESNLLQLPGLNNVATTTEGKELSDE